jgi:hypothetical protein
METNTLASLTAGSGLSIGLELLPANSSAPMRICATAEGSTS